MTVNETSNSSSSAAVNATNTAGGPAMWATSAHGRGVVAVSEDGVPLWGETKNGRAVVGAVDSDGTGVWGETQTGRAVVGVVDAGAGTGVWGETTNGTGVIGKDNAGGDGVVGEGRRGVVGRSPTYQGVYGWSDQNAGVVAESQRFHALYGVSHGQNNAGVFAYNDGGGWAASFQGRVHVEGDLTVSGDVVLTNADCAEDFTVVDPGSADPGTVMVLTDDGALAASGSAYDSRVAGVVSGAGTYRPGIVLDRASPGTTRRPVALIGKVWCKVDATEEPLAVGDLLTTSHTVGHAMKATDAQRAFGAIIGKALAPLASGRGLVPILVALQ